MGSLPWHYKSTFSTYRVLLQKLIIELLLLDIYEQSQRTSGHINFAAAEKLTQQLFWYRNSILPHRIFCCFLCDPLFKRNTTVPQIAQYNATKAGYLKKNKFVKPSELTFKQHLSSQV